MPKQAPPRKVLLVDDDEFSLIAGKRLLETLGCEVTLASSGREALAIAENTPFDVIFLDVRMPGQDGFATSLALRRIPLNAKSRICALSGDAFSLGNTHADHSYDSFLVKPLTRESLGRCLESGLKGALRGYEHLPLAGECAPPLDVAHGLKQLGGSWPGLAELLRSVEPYLDRFKHNFLNRLREMDAAECHRLAHSLKGSMLFIGASGTTEICARLEKACSKGELSEAATIFATLEPILTRLAGYSSSICCLERPPSGTGQ